MFPFFFELQNLYKNIHFLGREIFSDDEEENIPPPNNDEAPIVQIGGAESETEDPLPSTSNTQRKRIRSRSVDDVSVSSESSLSFIDPNENAQPINVDQLIEGPYAQSQVIFNDPNNLEMTIKKIQHRRETTYLDDHLFEITVSEKQKFKQPPLLITLLMIFREALISIINNLSQFYDRALNHQMYFTVIDDAIDHGLNTGNYNVHTDPEIVTDRILTMLYNFLQSHMSLRLNKSFRFNIKVLSVRHAQHRTQRGGFNPHILNGSFNLNRKKYLLSIPEGFEGFEFVFSQNCLLLSLILGNYLNASQEKSVREYYLDVMKNLKSENTRLKIEAGQQLLNELFRICTENNIANIMGPHSLEEIAPKLSSYFNCQIIVFNNLLSQQISYIFPPKYDETKKAIFLLQEISAEGKSHISLINRIKSFWRFNFLLCLHCEKVFRSKSHIFQIHKCQKRQICDACQRYKAFPDTHLNLDNIINYCVEGNKEIVCDFCKIKITNDLCFKYHQCSEYFCQRCDTLVKRTQSMTLSQTQKRHKCNETYCYICTAMVPSKSHNCKLRNTKIDKNQPAIGFFNFQIANLNNSSCYECFRNKSILKNSLGIEWDEFLRTKIDETKYLCDNHIYRQANDPFVNLATLKVETKKRGTFETMVFCDDELSELGKTNLDSENLEYCEIPINRDKIASRFGKSSRPSNIMEQNINNLIELKNKNAVEKMIVSLLQFYNTTLICFGVEQLLFVYKCFIDHGISCKPFSKGQNIYSLEVETYGLRFINLQNYFKVPLNELIDLFELDLEKLYFPEVLNCRENYKLFLMLMPNEFPVEFFYNFNDTLKEKENKKSFVQKISFQLWNFQKQLLDFSLFQLNVILLASIKFTSNCIDLQNLLRESVRLRGIEIKETTLPFARNFCTISGFIYNMFKMFYVDPRRKIYVVKNEYPKKIQSSKEEMEFAAFLQHKYPNKKFNNVFSLKCDRDYKRAIADVLCYDDNLIYFFNECVVHGHDPKDCPITIKNKKKSYFGRSFDDLRKEFEEKMLYVRTNYNVNIKVVWQCEWRYSKQNDTEIKNFLRSYIPWPSHHISPREAVRGARVEAFSLRWRSEEHPDERMYYVDCSSLYPYMG